MIRVMAPPVAVIVQISKRDPPFARRAKAIVPSEPHAASVFRSSVVVSRVLAFGLVGLHLPDVELSAGAVRPHDLGFVACGDHVGATSELRIGGEPAEARPVEVDDPDVRVASCASRRTRSVRPSGDQAGSVASPVPVGSERHVRAVGVHQVDPPGAVAVAREGDPPRVGRPHRIRLREGGLGQPRRRRRRAGVGRQEIDVAGARVGARVDDLARPDGVGEQLWSSGCPTRSVAVSRTV